MIEFYAFVTLAVALFTSNIVFVVFRMRKEQFACNIVLLALLAVAAYFFAGANTTYGNLISENAFSSFFISLFCVGMILLHTLAYGNSREYTNFAMLSSFSLMGMFLIASASTLISIFLGLELMAIPSTFIVLLSRRESLEAATKLFIASSIAVSLLSFAIVLVYGSANSLSLASYQNDNLMEFAFVLFLAALGFEASIFPFSILIPDVYQGSGAFATAMLGGINKKAGFAALTQVLILIFIRSDFAFELVALLAAATILYGNVVALTQDNLKRMLAYSSISQAGYILIGLAVNTNEGLGAAFFQMFAHAFMFIGAMSVIAWLERKGRTDTNDLIGLFKENRLCAVALTVFLLSMLGVPLTVGFIGKLQLFFSAINSGTAWLALVGIFGSVVSAFYYVKILSAVYTKKAVHYRISVDTPTLMVIVACIAIVIVFGVYPQPIIQIAGNAASYLRV
jgi:proton-translocating NADH-quinone oxidoreductase chain N